MKTTIDIQTKFNKDLIEQSILYPNDSLIQQTTKQIIRLQDRSVKDALEKLGWLSPEEAENLLAAATLVIDFKNGTDGYVSGMKIVHTMFDEYPWNKHEA